MGIEKTCSKCKNTLPLTSEHFARRRASADGFQPICKPCERNIKAERYQQNLQEERAKRRAYAAAHRPEAADRWKTWAAQNSEHVRSYTRTYREQHLEAAQSRAKKYRAANPEAAKVSVANRRARHYGVKGRIGVAHIRAQLAKQQRRCYWCGTQLDQYAIDHVIAMSRGGANTPENLVCTCMKCNNVKQHRHPEEAGFRPFFQE